MAKRTTKKTNGRSGYRKLTVAAAKVALEACQGHCATAAKRLGVAKSTLNKFMREHPDLDAIRDQANELLDEQVQIQINKAIHEGDGYMVRWYAERRIPGYGNKVSVKSDSTVTVANDFDPESMSEDELIAYQALLEVKAAAANGSGDD